MATESPDLNHFLLAAQRANGNEVLALTSDREGVVTRTGRFARWISHFRRGENRELSLRFISALDREYGPELTREVTRTHRRSRIFERSKPLTARLVTRTNAYAAALKADHHIHNAMLARELTNTCQENRVPHLKKAISEAAERVCLNDRSVGWIVDYKHVAAAVWKAIVLESGEKGARRLTKAQATEVLAEVAEREVQAAYRARQAHAVEALDPRRPGSIAHSVLAEKFADQHPSLEFEKTGLTSDAADTRFKQFETAIGTAEIAADELDDETALRILADEKLTSFMQERAAACARVDELDFLDDGDRWAMRAGVTRDDIPAALVDPLGRAYREVKDDLHALARPLPPGELHDSLSRLHGAISRALETSRAQITVENQDRMYRSVWRVLLAPCGEARASAILRQLDGQASPLRGIAEAVIWYRENFPGTDEWDRTFRNAGEELNGRPIYENESRKTAVEYAVMMRTLQQVAAEHAGVALDDTHVLGANANPDDQAVNSVRNLGIPFPAPDRVGFRNDNAPLSDGARAEMEAALDRHVETAGRKRHVSGLVNECVRFLRASDDVPAEQQERVSARFIVDGEPVERNADAVTARLQEFCTDGNGVLNETMLAGISLVANHAPFRCVYAGCMNPDRPDLATMNGYPQGVFLGHTYTLWKNAPDDVRLQVRERIKPLCLHPVDQYTILPTAGDGQNGAGNIEDGILLSDESDFQSVIELRFDPQTWRPEFNDVRISYALTPGMPSTRWFIKHPDLESRSGTAGTPEPGPEIPGR